MAHFGFAVVLILLACQTWSSLAYNNHSPRWTIDRSRPRKFGGEPAKSVVGRNRHLSETQNKTSSPGWRATLVHEDQRDPTLSDLSAMERIQRQVKRSVARSKHFDSRVKRAIEHREGRSVFSDPGRKALEAESVEAEVYPTGGGYSMTFSLGSPPQQVIAVADTGSDLVWVQCASCTQCFPQPTAFFNPTLSTTYTSLSCTDAACNNLGSSLLGCSPSCQYTYSYGDQSQTSGEYVSDVFTLNSTAATATGIPNFFFGCGEANSGTFADTDGIVGLGRGPISFPSQIAASINESEKFSYCLQNFSTGLASSIIFGDSAVPTNFTAAATTPIQNYFDVSMVPFYYVNLISIAVGGTVLDIPASAFSIDIAGNGGTIFDSGTTFTMLAPEAYQAVLDAYQSSISYTPVDISQQTGLDLCYDVTGLTEFNVSSFTFVFEPNAVFDLPFDNIFTSAYGDGETSYLCLAFLQSSSEMNIVGNTQQQNFHMLYDQDLLQISWLQVQDCTTV